MVRKWFEFFLKPPFMHPFPFIYFAKVISMFLFLFVLPKAILKVKSPVASLNKNVFSFYFACDHISELIYLFFRNFGDTGNFSYASEKI